MISAFVKSLEICVPLLEKLLPLMSEIYFAQIPSLVGRSSKKTRPDMQSVTVMPVMNNT
jgi:hypothetical protein